MKKLFMTMLTVLASGAAFALPVGNPSEPGLLCDGLFFEGICGDICDPCLTWCDSFSLRIGFYGDYVWNRHMEISEGITDGRRIEHFEIYTNAIYFAGNFWDRFDVFATIGDTKMHIDTNHVAFFDPGSPGTSGNRFVLETDTDISWSFGGRGIIWECGCTTLGAEIQYFYTRPNVKRITVVAANSIYPHNPEIDLKFREWQVGLGVSHRINFLIPYLALKWSHAQAKADSAILQGTPPAKLHDMKTDKEWGYAVGVTFVDCEKAAVTVEGRFADEKALYVNGQFRF